MGIAHLWWWLTGARDESGTAYGLWSGFGGAVPDVMILAAMIGWYKHQNCHQHRCWRIGRHKVGDTGIVVCRRHHPVLGQHDRLTGEAIKALHRPPKTLVRPK